MSELTNNTNETTNSDKSISGSMVETATNSNNVVNNITSYKGMGKGSNPNSKKNLMLVKTSEEARKRGRNGGLKSAEVRKTKKTMRETLENALKIELSKEKLEELGADIGLMNGETSVLSAIIASTIREAINGDTKAIQFVRDSIGEQPKTEVVQEVITKDDMALMESLRDSLIDKVM